MLYFITFLFATLLILMIPFFCVFVQTIKNLIAFVFLIFLVSINLMLFYSIEFFSNFFYADLHRCHCCYDPIYGLNF